jgi:hypothetical protein
MTDKELASILALNNLRFSGAPDWEAVNRMANEIAKRRLTEEARSMEYHRRLRDMGKPWPDSVRIVSNPAFNYQGSYIYWQPLVLFEETGELYVGSEGNCHHWHLKNRFLAPYEFQETSFPLPYRAGFDEYSYSPMSGQERFTAQCVYGEEENTMRVGEGAAVKLFESLAREITRQSGYYDTPKWCKASAKQFADFEELWETADDRWYHVKPTKAKEKTHWHKEYVRDVLAKEERERMAADDARSQWRRAEQEKRSAARHLIHMRTRKLRPDAADFTSHFGLVHAVQQQQTQGKE